MRLVGKFSKALIPVRHSRALKVQNDAIEGPGSVLLKLRDRNRSTSKKLLTLCQQSKAKVGPPLRPLVWGSPPLIAQVAGLST